MSSMDKETMKILLKTLQSGLKGVQPDMKEKLKKNASNILDKDRQKELETLLDRLEQGDDSSDNFLVRKNNQMNKENREEKIFNEYNTY